VDMGFIFLKPVPKLKILFMSNVVVYVLSKANPRIYCLCNWGLKGLIVISPDLIVEIKRNNNIIIKIGIHMVLVSPIFLVLCSPLHCSPVWVLKSAVPFP